MVSRIKSIAATWTDGRAADRIGDGWAALLFMLEESFGSAIGRGRFFVTTITAGERWGP
jgi:hypothetical protein